MTGRSDRRPGSAESWPKPVETVIALTVTSADSHSYNETRVMPVTTRSTTANGE